jgi:hypothetical protein
MLYRDLIPYLINTTNTCEEAPLLRQTNLALQQLNDAGIFVGSIVRAKIKTFDGVFTLPREMRRAISVQQCDGSIANAGYYQIDNAQALYISPEFIQDAPISDLGEGVLEREIFSPSKIYVTCDYEADNGIEVQIQGLYADIPTVALDSAGYIHPWENLSPVQGSYVSTQRHYSQVTSFTKPVTKGPVRLVAETAAGIKYLLLIAWPDETSPTRRQVRFSDLYQPHNPILRVTISQSSIQLDFQETPDVVVGSECYLSGFTPNSINGMHLVSAIIENSVYFQSPLIPITGDPREACAGCFLTAKTLSVVGTRQFVYLSGPDSIVPFPNIPAIRCAVRAIGKFEGDDIASYEKYMGDAVVLLQTEIKTYGLDPTNQAQRTEQYRFAIQNYPQNSIGAVAARIAQDLRKQLKVPFTDMIRFVQQAEEQLLTNGLYMDAVIPRDYATDQFGMIELEDDCYSILAAKIKLGPRVQLESRYYDYQKDPWWAVAGANAGSGLQSGAWAGYGAFAGSGTCCRAGTYPIPIQADFAARLIDQSKGKWRLDPQYGGISLECMVRLRSCRYSCPTQEMVFRNFAALKVMTESVLAADLKDNATEAAKYARAIELADKDLGASRGGSQLRGRMSRWSTSPTFQVR